MAKIEVKMPKMGESITEGTVITWYKKPGEAIELDETLLEIGTDKVDTEVPSPAAGVLSEILVPEGETVDVGVTIAVLETEADAVVTEQPAETPPAEASAPVEAPATSSEAPASETPPPAAPMPSNGAGSGERTVVVMPKMGESITEGTVIAWHKKPGDVIELDETLLEIGTDKVDTEVPSPAAGVLAEILVPEGETVEVGTEIAIIASGVAAGTGVAPAPAPVADKDPLNDTPSIAVPSKKVEVSAGDGAVGVPEEEIAGNIPRRGPGGQFFSPLVRSIAEKEGLSVQELASVAGSGREGRITKEDVLAYIEQRKSAPASPQPVAQPRATPANVVVESGAREQVVKMDRMRQIIAEHMVRSKATSAHVTSFAEIDVTNLVKVRERNKSAFQEREGTKLTYTPFLVSAAVESLREHPVLNASVDGDNIIIKKDYHIGIAVAIDTSRLVVPVIRNAGQLNLAGIAHASADLATRARTKKLQPDDLQGGTFTVTNVGSIGSLMGTPIINQPQVAILATGAIKKRPVVVEDPEMGDVIAIRHMMYVSLSYDHRIIDGAMASSFLRKYVEILESHDPKAVL